MPRRRGLDAGHDVEHAGDPAGVGGHAVTAADGEDLDPGVADEVGDRARQGRVTDDDDALDVVAQVGREQQPAGAQGLAPDAGP